MGRERLHTLTTFLVEAAATGAAADMVDLECSRYESGSLFSSLSFTTASLAPPGHMGGHSLARAISLSPNHYLEVFNLDFREIERIK